MTAVAESAVAGPVGRERLFLRITRAAAYLDVAGLGWVVPLLRMAAGDTPRHQLAELRRVLLVPFAGISVFLLLWAALAPQVKTSLGAVPGPLQVWHQAGILYADHVAERAKEATFY